MKNYFNRLIILGKTLNITAIRIIFLLLILVIILIGIFASQLIPSSTQNVQILLRLKPPVGSDGFDERFFLGTDALGRDLLSLLIHGTRVSLIVGFSSVILAGFIGVCLGLISGYSRGITGDIIMRIADVQMAFPPILLYIAAMAVLSPSIGNVILVLGIGQWVTFARIVRSEVLSVRELEYCKSAKVAGASNLRIILKHILPNITPSIIVVASFSVANSIVSEASLSFLGLGVPASMPSWGRILSEARPYLRHAPWLVVFPSIALFLTILSMNIIGDWLRDYLDPTLKT